MVLVDGGAFGTLGGMTALVAVVATDVGWDDGGGRGEGEEDDGRWARSMDDKEGDDKEVDDGRGGAW